MRKTPTTSFDAKIETGRAKVEEQEDAIADAKDRMSQYHAEGEALLAEVKAAGRDMSEREHKRLEVLRAKHAAASQDYVQADKLRLRARARLTALEAARERYLLEEHGIFPDRKRFPDVDGGRPAEHDTASGPEKNGTAPDPNANGAMPAPLAILNR